MHIKEIKLSHFRNYKELVIQLDSNLNIIFGDNAQGKTNILESIYLCATSKSHRTNNSKEMIELGCDEAHIQLVILSDDQEINQETIIDVHLNQLGKKHIAINKLPIKKLEELLGCLHVIMFSPEDLNLIKSGPNQRRRFIDIELSQLNGVYYHYLHQYHHLLKQRNALLKQCQKNYSQDYRDQLDIWDIQFLAYGKKVIEMRENFIQELNEIYKKRHFDISGGTELMQLSYEKNCTMNEFENKLKRNQEKDIKLGNSSVGPHRDDLLFDLNGIDLRKYGSQGQQRTAALSLKLSEIELVIKKNNIIPILLLDDVLSELDVHRQTYLMENLDGIQTLLTCTGVEDFIQTAQHKKQFFHVTKGEIA